MVASDNVQAAGRDLAAAAGQVVIDLRQSANIITCAGVRYQRPQPGQALTGLSPADAARRIRQLFTLCPVAQLQAAEAALALPATVTEQQIIDEWVREQSWQLWLMLNELGLGAPAMPATVALRRPGDAELRRQQGTALFGISPEQWLQIDDEQALARWWQSAAPEAPYAKLMAALCQPARRQFGNPTTPAAALRRCASHPLIAASLAGDTHGALLQHTLARLVELARLLSGSYRPPTPVVHSADPVSRLSRVTAEAVRGRLTHQVQLSPQTDTVITDYQIEAPTDRYCQPDGIVAQSLGDLACEQQRVADLKLLLLAIAPCVPFELSLISPRESGDSLVNQSSHNQSSRNQSSEKQSSEKENSEKQELSDA